MPPEIYICDICWRDTISKSRICARCRLRNGGDGRGDDGELLDDDDGGDTPRSDSQYHGDNYE